MCGNSEVELLKGERLDDLQCGNYKLIQRVDAFRFGTDSVLLADFASPRKHERAVDLGAGTGAIATLMAAHEPSVTVEAVEIQPDVADMARRSAVLNGITERVRVHCMDMREAPSALGRGAYSLVVCNPPYCREGGALVSQTETNRLARHECGLHIADVARAAAALLKNGGRFAVIYPAPRAFELMLAMRDSGMSPKRVRTIHAFPGRAPKLLLMDAVKGAGEMLHWQAPLILRNADDTPSPEWLRIYSNSGNA